MRVLETSKPLEGFDADFDQLRVSVRHEPAGRFRGPRH